MRGRQQSRRPLILAQVGDLMRRWWNLLGLFIVLPRDLSLRIHQSRFLAHRWADQSLARDEGLRDAEVVAVLSEHVLGLLSGHWVE